MTRPEACTQEILVFLDLMKLQGHIGFGITERVERAFHLTPQEAVSIIRYWIATYGSDGPR